MSDFPAGENVPGQAVSRTTLKSLAAIGVRFNWWAAFEEVRASGKYQNWRISAYIGWASAPLDGRIPSTQDEFATLIGLRTSQAIRRWRLKYPDIDQDVMRLRTAAVFDHVADLLAAAVTSGVNPDPRNHADRKMLLEATGALDGLRQASPVQPTESEQGEIVITWDDPDRKTYVSISPDDWGENSESEESE